MARRLASTLSSSGPAADPGATDPEVGPGDTVLHVDQVLVAHRHIGHRPRPRHHHIEQDHVGVVGVVARDDDLDSLFVETPVGLDPEVARQPLVDGLLGVADLLGAAFVEPLGADDIDELDTGSEPDPQPHRPRHDPTHRRELAIDESPGVGGRFKQPPIALAGENEAVELGEIDAATDADDAPRRPVDGAAVRPSGSDRRWRRRVPGS